MERFPIFVLGQARSGTTLLQRVLNSLDGVTIAGEHFGFLSSLSDAYFGMLEEERFRNLTPDQVRDTLADASRPAGWVNYFDREALLARTRGLIESLCRGPERRDRHWGFKEVRYLTASREVDLLALLYPDARFVFIVRHPLDVLVSNLVTFGAKSTPWTLAWEWSHRNQNLLDFAEKHPDTTFVIRYEDLILPEGTQLDTLVQWLGFGCTDRQRRVIKMPEARQSRLDIDARSPELLLTRNEMAQTRDLTEPLRKRFDYGWPERSANKRISRVTRTLEQGWEWLRDDITFASNASLSPLMRDLVGKIMELPGWFTVDDCAHFAMLLGAQAATAVRGDILEMGSHYGRSSCLLAHHLRSDEKLVLSEIFGTTERWQVNPPTSPELLRDNIRSAVPEVRADQLDLRSGRELELGPERVFRFIHLYGWQRGDEMVADLRLAKAHLGQHGVIALDPYGHPWFPEVTDAVDRFLESNRDLVVLADMNRHGSPARKLYLYNAL